MKPGPGVTGVLMDQAQRERRRVNWLPAVILAALALAMYLFAWFKDWS